MLLALADQRDQDCGEVDAIARQHLAEIAGCFYFWAWLRMGKSPLWLGPGFLSLVAFAWLLTRVDSDCRVSAR
jgi:drug/metabolite transporter superfamily protein YnfA